MGVLLERLDSGVRDGKSFLLLLLRCLELCDSDGRHQPRISFERVPLHLNSCRHECLSSLRDTKTDKGECFVFSKTTIKVL